MSRRLAAGLAVLMAAASPAAADDLGPAAMIERFVEYVYSAHPRDQRGLEQTAWLMRHCAQPLCERLEHQIHSRKTKVWESRSAIVLSVTERAIGQWEADVRMDTSEQRKMPVVMMRATILTDAGGKVVTFVTEPY